MTQPGIERRRTPRAPAEFAIQLGNRGETREARVKDLSANGICCLFPEPIAEMTIVELAVSLPDDDVLHSIQGAVVRCEKVRDHSPPTYEIAVYFTEMPSPCRRALMNFVSARLTA